MLGRITICGVMVAGLLLCTLPLRAQDKPADAKAVPAGADMEAAMKEWAKWATPGDPHKSLEKMVGNWNATTKLTMDPSAPPIETKGSAKNTMTLGGRWLKQEFTGDMMGMPFEGVGMTGYDNFKGVYVSTWVDNMMTAMMQSTGSANEDGSVITFNGVIDEPVTGERNKKFRAVMKWLGPDTIVYESYDNIPGKGEVKVMEVTYTRAK